MKYKKAPPPEVLGTEPGRSRLQQNRKPNLTIYCIREKAKVKVETGNLF